MRCRSKKRRMKLNAHMPNMYDIQKSLTSLPASFRLMPRPLAYSGTQEIKPN
ncbi:hypothetical protein D3C72_2080440 [compost metagenome]